MSWPPQVEISLLCLSLGPELLFSLQVRIQQEYQYIKLTQTIIAEYVPPHLYVEALNPSTSECDYL